MAKNNNEFKVSFEADTKDYQKAMKAIDNESKSLTARLKLEQEQMRDTATAVEKLEHKQQGLVEQQKLFEKQIRETTAQHQRAVEMYGAESEEARKYEMSLVRLQTQQAKLSNQMRDTESYIERQNNAQRDLRNMLSLVERDIDSYADTIGQDMVNAIKSGRATTQQLERAISSIASQAGVASQDVSELSQQLRQLGNGANINQIRSDFNRLTQTIDDTEQATRDLNAEMGESGSLIAGAASVVTGGIAVESALQDSDVRAIIDVTFDVPDDSKESVLDAIRAVQAYGVDAEEALEGVRRQWALNGDVSDDVNAKITKDAAAISKLYRDIDFWELIQEANEIGGVLGITTDDALAMTDALLKTGFPPDQLDIISEYGNQLKMAGFNALEVQAIMSSGVDTKTWNIDNLLDGIKEGRIVGAELGAELSQGFLDAAAAAGVSTDKFKVWGQQIARGGEEGAVAMQKIAKELSTVEDDTARNTLGVALYGTLWEEQGTKIIDTLVNMDSHMTTAEDNAQGVADTVRGIDASALYQLQVALQDLMIALSPVFSTIAGIVTVIANWVSQNPELTATFVTIIGVAGTIVGILTAIGAIITFLQPIITVLTTIVSWASRLAALLSPQGLIALAVIGLVALIVKYWDEVSAVLGQGLLWLSDMSQKAQDAVDLAATWIVDKMRWAWDGITGIFSGMGDFFGNLLTAPLNMFVEGYNYLADKLSELSITAPDWLPIIGGESLDINMPKMQYFADGGVMTRATAFGGSGNRVYVGGEAGREAILPLRADVLAGIGVGIAQSSGLGDNNGNGNTYITYDAIFKDVTINKDVDVDTLMQRIQRQIDKHNRGIR